MIRRSLLAAALLVLAAACGPAPSEPTLAHPAAVSRDEDPPADTTQTPADTTGRGGGGTLGSGT